MTKSLFLFATLILAAPFSQADERPQCAPTGWSCRNEPCCSILDYCNVSGVCTPSRSTQSDLDKNVELVAKCDNTKTPIAALLSR